MLNPGVATPQHSPEQTQSRLDGNHVVELQVFPALDETSSGLGECTGVVGKLRGVDRPRRHTGHNGKFRIRKCLGHVLQDTGLIGASRSASAHHKSSRGGKRGRIEPGPDSFDEASNHKSLHAITELEPPQAPPISVQLNEKVGALSQNCNFDSGGLRLPLPSYPIAPASPEADTRGFDGSGSAPPCAGTLFTASRFPPQIRFPYLRTNLTARHGMKRILFVFLDGVGVGPATADNPLASLEPVSSHSALTALAGDQAWTAPLQPVSTPDHTVRTLDATLDVDGLPQSGTGQASLFTGVNCAKRVGRHFGPFPHSATHEILATQSIFSQLQAANGSASDEPLQSAFANAYPPRFFEFARGRGRWTVTTRACKEAGVAIRDTDRLRHGRAVTADLTGAAWREKLGLDVDVCGVATAGRRLVDLSQDYAFTLFEYFLTDKVGHGRADLSPDDLLHQLDELFASIADHADPDELSLVVTSDHGNLEDVGVKTHTRHPVPLFVTGWAAPYFHDARSLTDVTPAVLKALRERRS